ncbi:hypothetical protein CMALT394_200029 [Carnobacterium maltaromaticum]|nr:hypothetical protein CMALT394_200029 [Carnobacterium maltaromaticum]
MQAFTFQGFGIFLLFCYLKNLLNEMIFLFNSNFLSYYN